MFHESFCPANRAKLKLIQRIDRVVEGAVIPLMTSEGQRINGSVVEVKEDVVEMCIRDRPIPIPSAIVLSKALPVAS